MADSAKIKLFKEEIGPYLGVLNLACDTIIEQEVSNYPIFVIFKNPIEIGIPLVEREKVAGDWSVNASTMEEFLARQVISNEKIEGFKKVFEDHDHHFCLFAIDELGANFVFLPKK